MSLVEFCRQLTAIDSSISHGTREIADFIVEKAKTWGLKPEFFVETVNGVENANVVVRPSQYNSEKPGLLFVSRLDTVDPGDYGYWVKTGANPFNASVDGENMYGLGLADAKADFACKLMALRERNVKEFSKRTPILLGTFGLGSGTGAIRFIRKKIAKIEAAVVGAPTSLRIANKGPGYAKVEISIPFTLKEQEFRESHHTSEASVSQSKMFTRKAGSVTDSMFAQNPIMQLIQYLKNLPSGISIIGVESGVNFETEPDSAFLELELAETATDGVGAKLIAIGHSIQKISDELKSIHHTEFSPPYSTITIGMVRTYPEEIRLSGVCRLVPVAGRDVYENWLEQLRMDCQKVGAIFHILDYKPPFDSSQNSAFLEELKSTFAKVGASSEIVAAKRCTEANVFHRFGVPTIAFGPGDFTGIKHSSQEHVRTIELETALKTYMTMIESMCL